MNKDIFYSKELLDFTMGCNPDVAKAEIIKGWKKNRKLLAKRFGCPENRIFFSSDIKKQQIKIEIHLQPGDLENEA